VFGSGSPRASIRPSPLVRRDPSSSGSAINPDGIHQQARISVVIPTLNEAANLPLVLPHIPQDVFEVILVDGASTDGTVDVARSLLPTIRILTEPRRGKGTALMTGFAAVEGDIVVMLDADGSTDPTEIPRFVDALLRGADFAKGSRFLNGGGSSDITTLRTFGNWGFVVLVRLLFGGRYTDLCYGYNAFWTAALPILALDGTGFEIETMMNVRALREGLHVSEVPSFERSRVHGASNLRAFRDGWRILRTIVRERAPQRRPITDLAALPGSTEQLAIAGNEAGPALVPVMATAVPSHAELTLDPPAVAASTMHLVPVMDLSEDAVPAAEDGAPHLVPMIDMLRASLQQAVERQESEASEGDPSLAYAVGGEI
jgi:hypothetical protein